MENELKVTFPGGKRVDAEYKGFIIRTDQSVQQGGQGSAPSPFDLFLTSIATCSGVYVLDFCQRRNISLEKAALTMRTKTDPETKRIAHITIEVQLPRGFPEKYKNAIILAVNGCTVKKHILKPPTFEVTTKIL